MIRSSKHLARRETLKPKSAAAKRAKAQRRKRLGKPKVARSAVSKGPTRDPAHLAKVREQPCLICDAKGDVVAHMWGDNPMNAHHPRELFPRTAGRKISDYLAVPLCRLHHSDQSQWDSIHKHNNEQWWKGRGVDPRDFIRSFSEEGRAALAALEAK